MIGFSTTNTGGPSVAAPGAAEPVVTNNPLSYGLPAGVERPIVLDMRVVLRRGARVRTLQMYGIPIPPGWPINHRREADPGPQRGEDTDTGRRTERIRLGTDYGYFSRPFGGVGLMATAKQGDATSEQLFHRNKLWRVSRTLTSTLQR